MPHEVSRAWLEEHGCPKEDFGDVPIPFVRMPPAFEEQLMDLAHYMESDDKPGVYDLESFSGG